MWRLVWIRLKWPFLLLIGLGLPTWLWDDVASTLRNEVLSNTLRVAQLGLWVGLWMGLAWLVARLIDVFVWHALLAQRLGAPVPKLLKDVVAFAVFVVALTSLLGVVFDLNVTGIWATSGVVTVVVGFAIQSMIADVFSGIALNIDRPFRIGEWITLCPRGVEPVTGRVEEVNWRSTRISTTEGNLVVVPNNLIGTSLLTNLSRPRVPSRFELHFCLDFSVPTERALRILSAGVQAADGPLRDPAPSVRVRRCTARGVEYEIRYWLDASRVSPPRGRHAVATSVLAHLHHAGITPAYEKQDLYVARMPPRDLDTRAHREELLRRVELFADLGDAELSFLAQQVEERRIEAGTDIVRQGDAGDSMYLVVEGLLEALVAVPDAGSLLAVGRLEPGAFFGEMSLLTGEKRSATVRAATASVVYEITKHPLDALFATRPVLAEHISRVVAERRLRTARRRAEGESGTHADEADATSLASQLLQRMRALFGFRNAEAEPSDA